MMLQRLADWLVGWMDGYGWKEGEKILSWALEQITERAYIMV